MNNTLLHYNYSAIYYTTFIVQVSAALMLCIYTDCIIQWYRGRGVKVSQPPGNVLLYEIVYKMPLFSCTAVQAYSTYIYNFGKTIIKHNHSEPTPKNNFAVCVTA